MSRRALDLLRRHQARPLVGLHASGGREIKQWSPERFGEVAARLARERGATIVLTGSPADRALVDPARRTLAPASVIDLCGSLDLLTLAAVLERLDVYVTGDTGPMHLAAAVGTPVVAVFGPSDPVRYAPRTDRHRIVRIDLPCSPCNRIRLPPARCVGHTPDCLEGIDVEMVYRAASRRPRHHPSHAAFRDCTWHVARRPWPFPNPSCRSRAARGRNEWRLAAYLDAEREEQAAADTYAWIKALRHAQG